MPRVTATTADKAKAEAFIVGVLEKDGERVTPPGLKAIGQGGHKHAKWLLKNKNTNLSPGSVISDPFEGETGTLVLVGLGQPERLTQDRLAACFANALRHVRSLGFHTAAATLIGDSTMDAKVAAQALTQGAIVGQLRFDQFRSTYLPDEHKDKGNVKQVQLIADGRSLPSVRKAVRTSSILADAVNDARLLANTPANIATPKWMASEARKRGRKHGYKVSVKGRKQLREQGYNALCAVAQGSNNEEQLITMDWNPPGAKKTLVLVGKGVCFDSGGISLKPGHQMWNMKYDKCGACNVIAAMVAIARLKVKHRVIGITPCVENMPSGTAQRPGDIITAKDGTTIEVLNTDAEGRLILADAITHGRTFKPDWIIEQSTLTGACEVAVGKTFVAAMGKDDEFVESVIDAASRVGDKAWRLPQGEEFDLGNLGTYADMANISLKVKAGTAIGGAFVGHFAKDTTFCHLDIAAKAWTDGQYYFGMGPTGAGLRVAVQRVLDEA